MMMATLSFSLLASDLRFLFLFYTDVWNYATYALIEIYDKYWFFFNESINGWLYCWTLLLIILNLIWTHFKDYIGSFKKDVFTVNDIMVFIVCIPT